MTRKPTSKPRRPMGLAVWTMAVAALGGCGESGSSKVPMGTTVSMAAPGASAVACFMPIGDLDPKEKELFSAAASGDASRLERTANDGGKLEASDGLQRTPVFAAAFCNQPESLAFLLDKGGNANARDALGLTPLHAAVVMGGQSAAKILTERGAKLDSKTPGGRTPLHLAAATGQGPIVTLLLAKGANTGIVDRDGRNASDLASKNGHSDLAAKIRNAKTRGLPQK